MNTLWRILRIQETVVRKALNVFHVQIVVFILPTHHLFLRSSMAACAVPIIP